MGSKSYSNITCASPAEGATKISEKIFITTKYFQYKTSHTLKIDVFELLDDKNIGKLCSKCETFFLD